MSEELAKGESWTLARLPGEDKGNDRLVLMLQTAFGAIEVETFYYCDSYAHISWEIKRKYKQLVEKEIKRLS